MSWVKAGNVTAGNASLSGLRLHRRLGVNKGY